MISKVKLLFFALFSLISPKAFAEVDYHFVGWANTLVPGLGQTLLGRYDLGAFQATYEVSTFYFGYRLSEGEVFSLDGFTHRRLTSTFRPPGGVGLEHQLYGDLLQEFSIKAHMVNTFEAYREAAKKRTGEYPDGIDSTSTWNLFIAPIKKDNISDPWVFVPLMGVFTATVIDYISQTAGPPTPSPRLTPPSNALYSFNYSMWQPIGSGAPEEMFYRGFIQNEFLSIFDSPYFAIPMSTLLFSLSHAPGDGRMSSAIAGGYLGYLAHRNHGQLSKGITVHFWSSVILGLETILLHHKGQQNTPPMGLDLQVNF